MLKDKPAVLKGEGIPEYEKFLPINIKSDIPKLLEELQYEFSVFEKELNSKLDSQKDIKWDEVIHLYIILKRG